VPLDHVPPVVPSVKVIVEPAQNEVEVEIAAGDEFTVTTVVAEHPVPSAYVMRAVPEDTPVTTPVLLTTVAAPVLPLDHVPPVVPSVNVIVEPAQKEVEVEMAAGLVLIVTIVVVVQPVPSE